MNDWLIMLLKDPKVRRYGGAAVMYAAGVHGGPVAAGAVRDYGPAVLDLLAKLIGG